ncbi:Calcium-binding protein 39, partial [Lemmus lemmus]
KKKKKKKKQAEKATKKCFQNVGCLERDSVWHTRKRYSDRSQLAPELFNTGLLSTLVANPWLLGFEGKKDVAQIFNNILRRQIGARTPAVEYICTQQNIFFMLLKGSESPEITFSCGTMLRECIRHEPLAKIILWSEQFFGFFRYVEVSIFDIVSEAFATLKFLEQHYDRFFSEYEKLLHSESYVAKRRSLQLLGELLLDRPNFTIHRRT